jgi:hypothetical protein
MEVPGYESQDEEERLGELASFYAIIMTCEKLESMFSKNAISKEDYERECCEVITQFKNEEVSFCQSGKIVSVDNFMQEYGVPNDKWARARQRLCVEGRPATHIYSTHDRRGVAALFMNIGETYITALDTVSLVQPLSELIPILQDLSSLLTRVPGLPSDFNGLKLIRSWLDALNGRPLSDTLPEGGAEYQKCLFDLNQSNREFKSWSESHR